MPPRNSALVGVTKIWPHTYHLISIYIIPSHLVTSHLLMHVRWCSIASISTLSTLSTLFLISQTQLARTLPSSAKRLSATCHALSLMQAPLAALKLTWRSHDLSLKWYNIVSCHTSFEMLHIHLTLPIQVAIKIWISKVMTHRMCNLCICSGGLRLHHVSTQQEHGLAPMARHGSAKASANAGPDVKRSAYFLKRI